MANPPPPQFEHFRVMTRPDGSEWVLGRGGMGTTYRAMDLKLGREVALKVIDSSRLLDEAARQRFLREAKANARLHHRNIAAVFHQGQIGETCYYAMELIEGETLQQILKARGALPLEESLEIIHQATQALSEAEKNGLVHRDIKPANLMLKRESDGAIVVKLIDFGLVKAITPDGPSDTQITVDGGYLGTAMTSSPEQCRGNDVDTRSDIYSLGVVLWCMIEGRPPFEDENHFRLMMSHLETAPPLERLKNVPPEVVRLLKVMLEKKREDRPANTAELLRLIAQARKALQPVPAPVIVEVPAEEEPAGFPWVASLLGTLLLGVIGFIAWQIYQAPEKVEQPAGPKVDVEKLTGPAIVGDGLLEQLTRLTEAMRAADWNDSLKTAVQLPAMATNPDRTRQVERALEELSQRLLVQPELEWSEDVRAASSELRAWIQGGSRPATRFLMARALRQTDPAASAELVQKVDGASLTDFFLRLEWQSARYVLETDAAARTALDPDLEQTLKGFDRYPGPEWKKGLPALRDLANAGHLSSLLLLGRRSEDPNEAVAVLMRAVQQLDKPALWATALPVYLDLVKKSPDESVATLMRKRIDLLARGFVDQPETLADASFTSAQPYFEQAAAQGIPSAGELLGNRLLATQPAAAAGWLTKAAEAGSAPAMVQLAVLQERGQGLPADPQAARGWVEKAANAGHPAGQLMLAKRLLADNQPDSDAKAVSLLEKAAALNFPGALDPLADVLRKGRGVKPDAARARQLYQKAASSGSSSALGQLATMWLNGEGGPSDPAKAIELLQEGANRNNPWCQYLLGHSLWEGKATTQDRERATRLLVAAASGGITEARRFCQQNGITIP